MPTYPRALAALAASLLLTALVACGSSNDDGGGSSGAAGTGKGAKGATGPGADFRDHDLVVTAVCSAGADGGKLVSVDGWDPKTWKHEAKAEFTVPATVIATKNQIDAGTSPQARSGLTALCTPDEQGPLGRSARDGESHSAAIGLIRSLFDRRFTKLAVVVRDQASGATHAGYIARGGQLTDLTSADTGFGSTPNEQFAVFSPDGKDVWFTYRAGDRDTKIGNRSVAGDHKLTEQSPDKVPSDDTPLFLVGNPVRGLVAYNVVVSPDGKRYSGWAVGNNNDNVFAVPDRTSALKESTPKAADNGCAEGVGWVDDDTLLCQVGGDDNLALVDVDASSSAQGHDLLPNTNRDNTGMVLSPDGSQVAFLSAAETDREYWICATQPGTAPRKVERTGEFSALGDTAVFIDWR